MGPRRAGYRADIDGLRAIAIVPVVFYHFGFPSFAGGFIGVDIFFVISGYLISGMLWAEIDTGSFSLAGFYERRVRRIFPAMAVVLATTCLAGIASFGPERLKELGNEIQRSGYFATNFWFAQKSDYFAAPSATRALLHSWSLAVEEQFYLLVPLLLRVMKAEHVRNKIISVQLFVLLLLSLGVSIFSAAYFPVDGFYLLPSRGWELLCGAVLAIGRPSPPGRASVEITATFGLIAILVSLGAFSAATPWPGAAALVPCLGTVAILWAGEAHAIGLVSRLLGSRLPVWLGRQSYPLYLWHWPVLVLFRHEMFRNPGLAESIVLILLSLALAAATTVWIEKPIRAKRLFASQRGLLRAGVVVLLLCFGIGRALVITNGLPQRFSNATLSDAGWYGLNRQYDADQRYCRLGHFTSAFGGDTCVFGADHPGGRPDFEVWGDSHASALLPAFAQLAQRYRLSGEIHLHLGCAPLLGVSKLGDEGRDCRAFNDAVVQDLRRYPAMPVFMVAHWADIASTPVTPSARVPDNGADQAQAVIDVATGIRAEHGSDQTLKAGLDRTLKSLIRAGLRPIIVQDNPTQPYDVAEVIFVARSQDRSTDGLGVSRGVVELGQLGIDRIFRDAQRSDGATYVQTIDQLCDQDFCPIAQGARGLYRDSHHLSNAGADRLIPAFEPIFQQIAGIQPPRP